jgi:hypothetical protein
MRKIKPARKKILANGALSFVKKRLSINEVEELHKEPLVFIDT